MSESLGRSLMMIMALLLCFTSGCKEHTATSTAADQSLVKASHSADEGLTAAQMHDVHHAEEAYKSEAGRYGTMDELIQKGSLNRNPGGHLSYNFTVTANQDHFQCLAVPVTYGTTGRFSYYINETGILRGGDHHGGSASATDERVNNN